MSGLRTNFGSENFHVIVETKQFIQLFCSNLVFLSFKILFNCLLAVKLKLCPFVESLQLLLASFLLINGFNYLVPIMECFGSITLHDRICLYKVNLVSWWLDIFFLDIELIYSFLWHFCNFVRNNRCKVGGSLSYVAISSKSQVSGLSNWDDVYIFWALGPLNFRKLVRRSFRDARERFIETRSFSLHHNILEHGLLEISTNTTSCFFGVGLWFFLIWV